MSILTERQVQVLELVALGYCDKDIATKLNMRPYTAKNHVHHINTRLNTNGRVESVFYAAALGLFDYEESQRVIKARVEGRLQERY